MTALSRKKGNRVPSEPDLPDPAVESLSQSSISADHLLILNRIHSATRGPYDVQELLDLLVKEIVDAVGARWGTIKLKAEEEDTVHTMIRRPGIRAGTVPRAMENTAFFLVMGTGDTLVIDDLESDTRFPDSTQGAEPAKSLLAVPIQHQGEVIGVLALVDTKEGLPFRTEDIGLTTLLATEAGPLIENARLVQEALARRAMERERELAEDVWKRFLPAVLPTVEGFDIAANCSPAQRIGGDYYDVISLPDGRTLVALGDVSGSGMPAALLMSNLQAALRVSLGASTDLPTLASAVNRHICSTTDAERYATLFMGIMDPARCVFSFVNAGHNPPVIFRSDGSYQELAATGIPVGFIPDAEYESAAIDLSDGDRLMIHSDGIPEAFSDQDEMFGDERLIELVTSKSGTSAQELLDTILTAVDEWSLGSDAYTDDRTLVILNCCKDPTCMD
ncbi:PP2C family protein-serine/threonine phosphatase [Gemmatimonadota bacterium]